MSPAERRRAGQEPSRLRQVEHPYRDLAAISLMNALDRELAALYGSGDREPTEPDDFTPPGGLFLVSYQNERAVACCGYRLRHDLRPRHIDAEIKRMYVAPEARRRGHGRTLLRRVEAAARNAGASRAVLETGSLSREAVALYEAVGYQPIPPYSATYRDSLTNRGYARPL